MSLLRLLKEDKNSRKVFGKREIKIIEKQLLGVNLTQSEKNRLSRDIRKKFEFIDSVSRFREDFKIKKGAEIEKQTFEAKEIIMNDPFFKSIIKIIIYGSAAENKLTLQSDIDIAVKFDKITLSDATIFRKRILGKANKSIDVQVYNHLPENIRKEIDTKGQVIYSK